MWYMIYSEDIDQSLNRRLAVRDQHLARLRTLQNQGRLLIAGPLPNIDSETPESAGFSGSLLVLAFDNLEQAQQWACEDPYVKAGIYRSFVVKPFKKVFP